jgi:hypothetical protein
MSQELITTSNADRNIYAGATVLSATPDASNPRLCYVMVLLGDGTKNLTGAGGDFSVTITIAGNTWNGAAQTRTLGSAVRSLIQTEAFFVPANSAVTVAITSPNSGDTDVDCTAYLVGNATSAAIGTAVMAAGDIDGYTLEQTLKLALAALAGKVSGGSTTTVAIRAADDSRARITATVDGSGNRTALTLDATN